MIGLDIDDERGRLIFSKREDIMTEQKAVGREPFCPLILATDPAVGAPNWARCRKEECAWYIQTEKGFGKSECAIAKIAKMSMRQK
jgi:hypothetical protein